ncbi:MAG: serine hydrolase [Bacteroidia bacterium]
MGSLAISQEGNLLYQKAIGHRYQDGTKSYAADPDTRYRIWSITKTYTATMIMQLVEEGKLSLDDPLAEFYPRIKNSSSITIRDMLGHRSGIRDFTRDESPIWDSLPGSEITSRMMIDEIANYESDFTPGDQSQYSNSNFLLLGYLIERLDSASYGIALQNRISNKLGLKRTTFHQAFPSKEKNEAFSYLFQEAWEEADEGSAMGPVPAAAGEIISTPSEMLLFIEALFAGKFISKESLALMLEMETDYGLGIMKFEIAGHTAYGHSGAYFASFSHLLYFPDSGISLAYSTNGRASNIDEILNYAVRISYDLPHGTPKNRLPINLSVLLGLTIILALSSKYKKEFLSLNNLRKLGYLIPIIFWISQFAGSLLYGAYNPLKDPIIYLDSQYSSTGPMMGVFEMASAILASIFMLALFKINAKKSLSIIPLFAILIIIVSQAGKAIFPFPHSLAFDLDQMIILSALGPLLSLLFWWKKSSNTLRLLYFVSLFFIVLPVAMFFSRSSFEVFGYLAYHFGGLLMRLIYLGWSLWFVALCYGTNDTQIEKQ